MGLTVSRKTAKNLAVRRKNQRILTVSVKKMLTVKKSNHKIRSRDLLLSLMCYGRHAFTDVIGRVDRRLDSSTILRLPTFFFFFLYFFFLSFFFFFFLSFRWLY